MLQKNVTYNAEKISNVVQKKYQMLCRKNIKYGSEKKYYIQCRKNIKCGADRTIKYSAEK